MSLIMCIEFGLHLYMKELKIQSHLSASVILYTTSILALPNSKSSNYDQS